jgi:glycine cleavage system transcriptional repressor
MKRWYMLTVVGRDQPGIVAALADALFRAGVNLGEASMVRLGGSFTIMLMVETERDASAIRTILDPAGRSLGLNMHVDLIDAQLHSHVEPNVRVTVYGADRPGIVAQVTAALASRGFNILDLESDVAGTREQPIYVMTIDGHCAESATAIEKLLLPLREKGVEVGAEPLETLVG